MSSKSVQKTPDFFFDSKTWLAKTASLSKKDKGIWIDLLAHMWLSDSHYRIRADWNYLSRLLNISRSDLRTFLNNSVSDQTGLKIIERAGKKHIVSHRLKEEWEKIRKRSDTYRLNASKRWSNCRAIAKKRQCNSTLLTNAIVPTVQYSTIKSKEECNSIAGEPTLEEIYLRQSRDRSRVKVKE